MHLSLGLGRLAAVAASVLTLTGCASMNVSSYLERGIDVGQYRTFGWGPAETLSTGDPRLDTDQFFDERVRRDVERELAARGFEKTMSGPADLLVHYHAGITQQIDARNIDHGDGYRDDDDRQPYVYEAGTLLIDLVDARTKKLVWRGWAEGSIDGVIDNQEWMEQRIDQVVARILERLPRKL
jgi:hypothetical protein